VQVRGWYDDAVRATDRNFTRLLAQWERTVGVGNSLVAFYSDHGEHLQEPNHRHDRHGDSMDEVLLHIPLAIRYPENQGIGARVDDRPVSLVDLVPTVLDVAGAAVGEEPLHGTSLAALARNASATDRAIFADFQLYGEELSSVRRGSRKLVLNTARGHQTLVDTGLAAELSAEHQARIDEPELESALVREYENYSERARNWSRGLVSDHEVDPQEALERLRAIGYVE
jgi:arylsulfatase A-like enzyme